MHYPGIKRRLVEESDGQRLWVEPIGLTKDLREWCKVDHVLPHLGPPMNAWKVLEEHPDAREAVHQASFQSIGPRCTL